MCVKCVKRGSKYTVRGHDIFTYNFLNIQPIFNLKKVLRSWDLAVSDLRGGGGGREGCTPPPGGPNSFNFMQFLGNLAKSYVGAPPGELAPPPRGNPGSATA